MAESYAAKVDRILRDFEGYSGDGNGGNGDLPVGDRSTARKPISTRDLRELMKSSDGAMNLAEANGYTDQVAEGLSSEIDVVRQITFEQGQVYPTTAAGLSNTQLGQQFAVASSDPDVAQYVYRHDAGPTATLIATTPSVSVLGSKAPINSPTLTGTPTAPTPDPQDRTTRIATAEMVGAVDDRTAAFGRADGGDSVRVTLDDVLGLRIGADGLAGLSRGPDGIDLGVTDTLAFPALLHDGAISRLRQAGDHWQYEADGVTYLARIDGSGFDPALLDTPEWLLVTHNGQSWNTQRRDPADIDAEDPSHRIRRRIEGWRSADAVTVRCDGDPTPRSPWDNRVFHRRVYSTDVGVGAAGPVAGLRRLQPSRDLSGEPDFYTIGDLADFACQHFLRQAGARRRGLIGLPCGRAGTDWPYFEANGPTRDDNVNNFFVNDTAAINQTIEHVRAAWFGRPVSWDLETYFQGGADGTQADDSSYYGHLVQRRADLATRGMVASGGGPQWLLVVQTWSDASEEYIGYQPMDQLLWAQTNPTGRDILIGAFHHLQLWQETANDTAIHATALSNVHIAEAMGLAMARCLDRRVAEWEPPWITAASISGSNLILTLNSPSHCEGLPYFDTEITEERPSYGVTLVDHTSGSPGAAIALGTPVVTSDTKITVPITGSLSGVTQVEVGFAARGTKEPMPEQWGHRRPACTGNIFRRTRFDGPFTGGRMVQPLCSFLKVISV